jgi:hypothetical protein
VVGLGVRVMEMPKSRSLFLPLTRNNVLRRVRLADTGGGSTVEKSGDRLGLHAVFLNGGQTGGMVRIQYNAPSRRSDIVKSD